MPYRAVDLEAKLKDLFPPSTSGWQCALISDFSYTLSETSSTAEFLTLEVNSSNRATFSTPAASSYQAGSFIIGAYFNFTISVVNSSGSLLEWSHYAILDPLGEVKTYLTQSSSQSASSTGSRDLGIKLEYSPPSSGG
jgi:hypothetical protein